MRHRFALFAALCAALFAAGCGGGGGSGSSADSSAVRVFATDESNAGVDHAWVTVHKVELLQTGGGTQTVLDSSGGVTVDLGTLSDNSGQRFAFLGSATVPRGIYTGVRVTLDKDLVVYPTGATTGVARQFAGAVGETAVLNVQFATPKVVGDSPTNVVVNFDSSAWTTAGTEVTATLSEFSGTGFDDSDRQEGIELRGTLSNLSGTVPTQTFTLTTGSSSVQVRTSASTVLLASGGATSLALANGQFVEIDGVFNPATGAIDATKVRVEDGPGDLEDEDEVRGLVSNVNSAGGTFSVAATQVFGFLPTQSTVNVSVVEATKYFGDSGVSISRTDFFSRLTDTTVVEAEGTYNAGTNTIVAKSVKIEDGANVEDRAELRGTISQVNVLGRSFVLTVTAYQGLFTSIGSELTISVPNSATLLSDEGTPLTDDQFFTGLGSAAGVEVEGNFDTATNTFVATKVKLDDEVAGGQVEIEGTASAVNAGGQALTITVFQWEGGFFSSGQQVPVVALETATFEDDDGNPLTSTQFFTLVGAGTRVDARGTVVEGTLRANRLRIKD